MDEIKRHIVYKKTGMRVSAIEVPGGLLMITEVYDPGEGNGAAVATSFVPMGYDQQREFLSLPQLET